MKTTFKWKGLVNVSGFHVDPGWVGPLIFGVFNAGPSPVHLHRGPPLFLIWYADLDEKSQKSKTQPGPGNILAATINNLTGGVNSIHALDKRVANEAETRREELNKLSNRIHDIEKSQDRLKIIATVLLTISLSIAYFYVRLLVLDQSQDPTRRRNIAPSIHRDRTMPRDNRLSIRREAFGATIPKIEDSARRHPQRVENSFGVWRTTEAVKKRITPHRFLRPYWA